MSWLSKILLEPFFYLISYMLSYTVFHTCIFNLDELRNSQKSHFAALASAMKMNAGISSNKTWKIVIVDINSLIVCSCHCSSAVTSHLRLKSPTLALNVRIMSRSRYETANNLPWRINTIICHKCVDVRRCLVD